MSNNFWAGFERRGMEKEAGLLSGVGYGIGRLAGIKNQIKLPKFNLGQDFQRGVLTGKAVSKGLAPERAEQVANRVLRRRAFVSGKASAAKATADAEIAAARQKGISSANKPTTTNTPSKPGGIKTRYIIGGSLAAGVVGKTLYDQERAQNTVPMQGQQQQGY